MILSFFSHSAGMLLNSEKNENCWQLTRCT